MEFLRYCLSAAVLVALFFTLMFWTQSFKYKKDKAVKNEKLRNAAVAFIAYLLLNVARLWVEGNMM